jgi:hypothetical protein
MAYNAPTFLLGATFNRTYTDWLMFISDGMILTTSKEGTKYGNEFLYQAGLGRNLFDIDSKWIIAWLVEVDGAYFFEDLIRGLPSPHSSGNIVTVTPSLWISSKQLIVQLGIGTPVLQQGFNHPKEHAYLLALNFGWTF